MEACPVCAQMIPRPYLQQHVNDCLDGNAQPHPHLDDIGFAMDNGPGVDIVVHDASGLYDDSDLENGNSAPHHSHDSLGSIQDMLARHALVSQMHDEMGLGQPGVDVSAVNLRNNSNSRADDDDDDDNEDDQMNLGRIDARSLRQRRRRSSLHRSPSDPLHLHNSSPHAFSSDSSSASALHRLHLRLAQQRAFLDQVGGDPDLRNLDADPLTGLDEDIHAIQDHQLLNVLRRMRESASMPELLDPDMDFRFSPESSPRASPILLGMAESSSRRRRRRASSRVSARQQWKPTDSGVLLVCIYGIQLPLTTMVENDTTLRCEIICGDLEPRELTLRHQPLTRVYCNGDANNVRDDPSDWIPEPFSLESKHDQVRIFECCSDVYMQIPEFYGRTQISIRFFRKHLIGSQELGQVSLSLGDAQLASRTFVHRLQRCLTSGGDVQDLLHLSRRSIVPQPSIESHSNQQQDTREDKPYSSRCDSTAAHVNNHADLMSTSITQAMSQVCNSADAVRRSTLRDMLKLAAEHTASEYDVSDTSQQQQQPISPTQDEYQDVVRSPLFGPLPENPSNSQHRWYTLCPESGGRSKSSSSDSNHVGRKTRACLDVFYFSTNAIRCLHPLGSNHTPSLSVNFGSSRTVGADANAALAGNSRMQRLAQVSPVMLSVPDRQHSAPNLVGFMPPSSNSPSGAARHDQSSGPFPSTGNELPGFELDADSDDASGHSPHGRARAHSRGSPQFGRSFSMRGIDFRLRAPPLELSPSVTAAIAPVQDRTRKKKETPEERRLRKYGLVDRSIVSQFVDPLHAAMAIGSKSLASHLLRQADTSFARAGHRSLALLLGALYGMSSVVNSIASSKLRYVRDWHGRTVVHYVVLGAQLHTRAVSILYKTPMQEVIDVPDMDGTSPLLLLCKRGGYNAAKLAKCLLRTADINKTNKFGEFPLFAAIAAGNAELVDTLAAHAQDMPVLHNCDGTSGLTPLAFACALGDTSVVGALLHHGLNPLSTSSSGRTALHVAVTSNSMPAVQKLLGFIDSDEVVFQLLSACDSHGCTAADLSQQLGADQITAVLQEYAMSSCPSHCVAPSGRTRKQHDIDDPDISESELSIADMANAEVVLEAVVEEPDSKGRISITLPENDQQGPGLDHSGDEEDADDADRPIAMVRQRIVASPRVNDNSRIFDTVIVVEDDSYVFAPPPADDEYHSASSADEGPVASGDAVRSVSDSESEGSTASYSHAKKASFVSQDRADVHTSAVEHWETWSVGSRMEWRHSVVPRLLQVMNAIDWGSWYAFCTTHAASELNVVLCPSCSSSQVPIVNINFFRMSCAKCAKDLCLLCEQLWDSSDSDHCLTVPHLLDTFGADCSPRSSAELKQQLDNTLSKADSKTDAGRETKQAESLLQQSTQSHTRRQCNKVTDLRSTLKHAKWHAHACADIVRHLASVVETRSSESSVPTAESNGPRAHNQIDHHTQFVNAQLHAAREALLQSHLLLYCSFVVVAHSFVHSSHRAPDVLFDSQHALFRTTMLLSDVLQNKYRSSVSLHIVQLLVAHKAQQETNLMQRCQAYISSIDGPLCFGDNV
jgi:ankyrin repeat protein